MVSWEHNPYTHCSILLSIFQQLFWTECQGWKLKSQLSEGDLDFLSPGYDAGFEWQLVS